ncbi:hypothetical protein DOE51_09595 [Bdellovibrio sp. NC01]|nr:hypothetical protein DOE51_09595 [Bdellovibrio sp. NC01]
MGTMDLRSGLGLDAKTLSNEGFKGDISPQDSSFEIDDQAGAPEGTTDPLFSENARSKTSMRMHYEAQVAVIRRQMGDLESVRLNLGLSQRKMAQLLMVDPSAWTRWTRQGDEAPPHIWRALQWFSVLQEKIPGLTPQYFINQSPQVLHQKALQELDQERQKRREEMASLHQKIEHVSNERDALQKALQLDLQNELHGEVAKLKKDLNFHKKMSIVILSLSIAWAAVLLVWKFA